jgi:hypothetical protein
MRRPVSVLGIGVAGGGQVGKYEVACEVVGLETAAARAVLRGLEVGGQGRWGSRGKAKLSA